VADFALWQHRFLAGPVFDEQVEFWKRQLAGAPIVLELPTDRRRPPVQDVRGRGHSLEVTPREFAAGRRLAVEGSASAGRCSGSAWCGWAPATTGCW
jgi:hypothetical protein